MGLKIEELRRGPEGGMYVSPVRLCVTADGELCDENDPRAVRLLVGQGGSIPAREAAQYGLIATAEAVGAVPAAPAASAPEAEDEPPKAARRR